MAKSFPKNDLVALNLLDDTTKRHHTGRYLCDVLSEKRRHISSAVDRLNKFSRDEIRFLTIAVAATTIEPGIGLVPRVEAEPFAAWASAEASSFWSRFRADMARMGSISQTQGAVWVGAIEIDLIRPQDDGRKRKLIEAMGIPAPTGDQRVALLHAHIVVAFRGHDIQRTVGYLRQRNPGAHRVFAQPLYDEADKGTNLLSLGVYIAKTGSTRSLCYSEWDGDADPMTFKATAYAALGRDFHPDDEHSRRHRPTKKQRKYEQWAAQKVAYAQARMIVDDTLCNMNVTDFIVKSMLNSCANQSDSKGDCFDAVEDTRVSNVCEFNANLAMEPEFPPTKAQTQIAMRRARAIGDNQRWIALLSWKARCDAEGWPTPSLREIDYALARYSHAGDNAAFSDLLHDRIKMGPPDPEWPNDYESCVAIQQEALANKDEVTSHRLIAHIVLMDRIRGWGRVFAYPEPEPSAAPSAPAPADTPPTPSEPASQPPAPSPAPENTDCGLDYFARYANGAIPPQPSAPPPPPPPAPKRAPSKIPNRPPRPGTPPKSDRRKYWRLLDNIQAAGLDTPRYFALVKEFSALHEKHEKYFDNKTIRHNKFDRKLHLARIKRVLEVASRLP